MRRKEPTVRIHPRQSVVVLNASFEILGVVPVARAMTFLMRERAVVVDAIPGEMIRSAEAEFPFPRVVQFREMIRVPYRYGQAAWSRRGVLQRDAYECAYCGARGLTIDHIVPRSRGGRDEWMNTICSCARCNGRKADRTLEESGMVLRFQPRVVTTRDTMVLAVAAVGADPVTLGLA